MVYIYKSSKGRKYYIYYNGRIYYLSKSKSKGALNKIPEGYEIREGKNGFSYLKKK